MTDEELDQARAEEAHNRRTDGPPKFASYLNTQSTVTAQYRDALIVAARLAREGWKPEDPLLKEAREACAAALGPEGLSEAIRLGNYDDGIWMKIAKSALRRGIEIERERVNQP